MRSASLLWTVLPRDRVIPLPEKSGMARWTMTRGRPRHAAVEEAMAYAGRMGYRVMTTGAPWVASDFMAFGRTQVIFVRVRRRKYPDYGTAGIAREYTDEIEALRAIVFPGDVSRELWVRGPDRSWHRYLVTAGGVGGIGTDAARTPAGSGSG